MLLPRYLLTQEILLPPTLKKVEEIFSHLVPGPGTEVYYTTEGRIICKGILRPEREDENYTLTVLYDQIVLQVPESTSTLSYSSPGQYPYGKSAVLILISSCNISLPASAHFIGAKSVSQKPREMRFVFPGITPGATMYFGSFFLDEHREWLYLTSHSATQSTPSSVSLVSLAGRTKVVEPLFVAEDAKMNLQVCGPIFTHNMQSYACLISTREGQSTIGLHQIPANKRSIKIGLGDGTILIPTNLIGGMPLNILEGTCRMVATEDVPLLEIYWKGSLYKHYRTTFALS